MEFSARMIADLVEGVIEGDENITVNTFAKIEEGHPGAISFLANPKYTHYIYRTQSSIVLVSKDFVPQQPVSATLIRVDNPYDTVSMLMQKVNEMLCVHPTGIEEPAYVHASVSVPDDAYVGAFAYIAKGAQISTGAKIYPQVYIGENVKIGAGTIIYAGAKIYNGTRIGANCIIHSGAVIGADGFGFAPLEDGTYRKIPQMGTVVIEDNVEIGANAAIDRATMGTTRIGRGTKIDNLVQIAHNVTVGNDTVMASQVGIAGSTHIGDNCVFAGQVGVAGHITIGDRVTVGAQSGIPNDVKSDSKVMGYPAVPGRTFARNAALMRRLPELFETVANLAKKEK